MRKLLSTLLVPLCLLIPGWARSAPQTIQEQLDSAKETGKILLPLGITEIGSLLCGNRSGLVVQGHGTGLPVTAKHPMRGSVSELLREAGFPNDKPMLIVRGAYTRWSDFSLLGDTAKLRQGTRPDIGILIRRDKGLGSGKHLFENLYIYNCKTAIQNAEGPLESNADHSTFSKIHASNCDTLFHNLNLQGHLATFRDTRAIFNHLPAPQRDADAKNNPMPAGSARFSTTRAVGNSWRQTHLLIRRRPYSLWIPNRAALAATSPFGD